MKPLLRTTIFSLLFFLSAGYATSQCENWLESPLREDAENAHSIYRQALKTEDYKLAFEYWQKAYEIAPAADGRRDYHFMDGIRLYKMKFKEETDEAKKKEYKEKILELYGQAVDCYKNRSITLKCSTDKCYNEKIGYILGRQAYDMFYELRSPYSQTCDVLKESLELAGNASEYIVFDPIANMIVYRYEKGKITADEARELYIKANEIADYNIANNKTYSAYYDQAKKAMNATFAQIESDIFDCDFFKDKFRPKFEEDPENPDLIKSILITLKKEGCADEDPFVMELDSLWKKYAAEKNAQIQAELEAKNPALKGNRLIKEGNYEEAADAFEAAIAQETVDSVKANYLYTLASLQFGELGKYSEARSNAREAARLKDNWGKPYILIGDMYVKSARNCGDTWNNHLAVLAAVDKYAYAKSIDPEVAEQAQDRINKMYGSLPSQDEGFMRGHKEGDVLTVDCWIAEKVRLRYK
jgi:tetratricopeptide (TPR) repeat protein